MEKLEQILFLNHLNRVGKVTIYKKYWKMLSESRDIKDIKTPLVKQYSPAALDAAESFAKTECEKIVNQRDITTLTAFDTAYPKKLSVMGVRKPLVLYVKGNAEAIGRPSIAVIGTRHPSEYSIKVERNLIRKILEISERVVISGLAMGCDKIAHETTVECGKQTIAILPSGVNIITPSSHQKLAEKILESNGCLISEYVPDAPAYRTSFVERDAITAALSDMTFVVECNVKSGTMHTINAAVEYGRRIACFYPKKTSLGNYSGNANMLEQKSAVKVSNTDELRTFLQVTS